MAKALQQMQAYAVAAPHCRFSVVHSQSTSGGKSRSPGGKARGAKPGKAGPARRSVLLQCPAGLGLRDRVSAVFGRDFASGLIEFEAVAGIGDLRPDPQDDGNGGGGGSRAE